MKRLILTFVFSIAITIAALIPLIRAGEISAAHAKESPDYSAVIPSEGQKPAAAQTTKARIWFAHLAPFAAADTAVTVTVKGVDLLTDFEFGETTLGYIAVDPGLTQIVVSKKSDGSQIIADTISLAANTDYTIAIAGRNTSVFYDAFDLYIVDAITGNADDNTPPDSGEGKLRIVHLAPFAPSAPGSVALTAVDILDENNDPFQGLTGVQYGDSSGYFSLPADSYDLTISAGGGLITRSAPITIADGEITTLFAIGDNVSQELDVQSVIYSGPEVYVAHVAPFEAMTTSTAVTVSINGSPAITDFTYGETSGEYLPLTLGDNIIEILYPNDTATISPILTAAKYTAAAIGDDNNQPLDLLWLEDEEALSTTAKVRIVHAAPFSSSVEATRVDVLNQDGSDLTPPVTLTYRDFTTPYLQLPAGTYDLKVNDTMTTVIDIPALDVANNDIVTIFAIGDGTNQVLHYLTIPPGLLDEDNPTLYLPMIIKLKSTL